MFGRLWHRPASDFGPRRGNVTHVIILDGTMSSLDPDDQTNAGRAYTLLREMGSEISIYYEPGLQWRDWRSAVDVAMGRGINRQIKRAYGYLASRFRPGDRIYMLGYSRGAYAVRSLAGIMDQVGLLRADCATERNIRDAYRHYENNPAGAAARAFADVHCHERVEIEAIGVWDTVKSLGINAPVLWRLTEPRHAFHNHDLGGTIRNGFQALAFHESRLAFAPVLWETHPGFEGHVEQVWFRGTHGDVGGQLGGYEAARPLANIPLVWLLARIEETGLPMPAGWKLRFEQDIDAPSAGKWRGYGKMFMSRRKRKVGADPSERLHETLLEYSQRAKPIRATLVDAVTR
ncbi:DUF2235 domain-containing protein [Sulfitobacter mediterraneus]|uniref:DUF2235 domain-containing protein n=1 Tax=Sulfitobacter mediterraneus TaxID=83219 RepID=UPI001934A184|nr:DUF2235 domain-containing protein [Sulfitobacter mediterraneus]MBM1631375.1 DUF2235 domain-containing protein [Sulfitobacter mediterraneus]MBM1639190.1 DUF2235 domain-containing protein [Sulfitobacter mediterraneus]MBM1643239.1 DUF2235 domain-containing protein [Sulfitobacter mediterraneus]MBM1647285.1 DUF2235 domain-containing protein [Sulfitobacter mediterraneus]MBM1651330.1 DUF2235 domain-containing protein [Sulfitobacter mediterraneus]